MKILLIAGAVFAVAIIGAFIAMGMQSRGGVTPGTAGSKLQPCGSNPNCVSSEAAAESPHHIAALSFRSGEEDRAWTDLVEAIAEAGGEIEENAPPYLAATFTSKLFGFVDDFECLVDRDAGVINVRSGSRVGYSDLGVNRKRVEQIRARLAALVSAGR